MRSKVPYLLSLLGGALVVTCLFLGRSAREAQAAESNGVAITYARGVAHVAIPYQANRPGPGKLTIEILDPEDKVIARSESDTSIGASGAWQADLKLAAMPVEDLVWHRLRYRFAYQDANQPPVESTDTISGILRMPVLRIVGQQTYLAGGSAAVRVVVTDTRNDAIEGSTSLQIELLAPEQKPRTLYSGKLNRRGTTEAQFRLPAGFTGQATLRYAADTPIGSTEYLQSIRIEDKASILLTTEKPIYQPGQTIHVRALALDRARHESVGKRDLTFELEDSRGNKVFRKATQTDKFGIASAEFGLADEVNLGSYHLRALMEGNTAELTVNVERYVLPKFKVAVDLSTANLSNKDAKTKHGYRPGDHVTGTIRANYFFGKAVEGGEVSLKASAIDVQIYEAANTKGKTDDKGEYHFDFALPTYFAGRPLSQGAARVLIEATVKDSAGHSETRGEPIMVSESPLLVTAVPEGGTLIPNLDNQVYLLASYPDGKPAQADLVVRAANHPDQIAHTDAGGVAVIRLQSNGGANLQVEARDPEGSRANLSVPIQSRTGDEQILLRPDKAVYRPGERMQLTVLSTHQRGGAYLDIVREGQTVLTRDVDLSNGRAELSLTVTPDLAGTLDVNAYLFGRDARPVGDHRLVFVQPADELKIETSTDRPEYKPGEDARIRFRVSNSRGEGVQAALGIQVVDEAVFALAEKQPGFAKVFFYLEQEVLKPRYEIHSVGMPEVVEPAAEAKVEQRDRAAKALFAATEMVNPNRFETEAGRTPPHAKLGEYSKRYQARFTADVKRLSEAMATAYPESRDIFRAEKTVRTSNPTLDRDAWGSGFRIDRGNWNPRMVNYIVRSAGPDKKFDTSDDLYAYVTWDGRPSVAKPSGALSRLDLQIEHDRGPFNGRAEITGVVADQQGGALAGVTVVLRDRSNGSQRTARTNTNGDFRMNAVPAGDYEIEISLGAELVKKSVSLAARDRAVIAANLKQTAAGMVISVVNYADSSMRADDRRINRIVVDGLVRGGPARDEVGVMAVAPPLAMAMPMMAKEKAEPNQPVNSATVLKTGATDKKDTGGAAPRVRSYFPEALYINPEIITDGSGNASISIPIADSITTWRIAMMASTMKGALGSGTAGIKVFQDFFADLDLPVTLTQGDRVSIPIAVYNYTGNRGDVALNLQQDDWFTLAGDTAEKALPVESGKVGGSQFTIEARRIGKFRLTLSAKLNGGDRADIVVREIEVVPDGREQNIVFNGRLENTVRQDLRFPEASVPEATRIYVRLYPGPLSQVVEGMDAILRMPGGCFEQTSSSTYPNVLALDYMKQTKKLTPEIRAKAEAYIANGYQRLLTFEVPGGGFSWFGNPPANKILTSYGLMEFSDMAKVYDVDPKLIDRTQQWLASQQQPDGSWKPDTQFINEGATNRYNSDVLRITAYIAWALENTGYRGPAVDRAKQYMEGHLNQKMDPYTLAVLGNFAAEYGKDRGFTHRALDLLMDSRTEKGDQVWWSAEETAVYATGASAAAETTGLAVQALLKSGEHSVAAGKALAYLAAHKDAAGTWGTTQATIMALRALLLSMSKGAADVRGTVEVVLNGKTVQKLELTRDNNDLLHQFVLKEIDARAANSVELRFNGKGGLAYQIVGRYFLPWKDKPSGEPFSIAVAYDRNTLAQDDIATATATVRNNMGKTANMMMVDLGIPPGFELLSEDLQSMQEKTAGRKGGRLEKFSLTATQAILYFDSIDARETVTVRYRLRAKYPIRARTFQSRVYEYYDPAVNSVAKPALMEVHKR